MLKAVTIATCFMITLMYILLLIFTYPYVCLIKQRPSSDYDDNYLSSPNVELINRQSNRFCSKKSQFNLIPMPSKIILSDTKKYIRLPTNIRIQSKYVLPFILPKTSSNAKFILHIDYQSNVTYPYLGIDESYQLNITSRNYAILYAKTYVGIIRGLSTFQQLQNEKKIPIPLQIYDKPLFIWRGLMLDVARHFLPLSVIKQTIRFMKLVKMNVLHLHLSDDQGFRLESKRFPRLHDSIQFYTQSDMQDLIEYARKRAIRIVPEFDMPAHTASWFVGYPQLASTGKDSYELELTWGVHNATMDVTSQNTYDFIEKFFAEMTHLFPDRYFHIGGDECVPHEWMESDHIRKFIVDKQLDGHQGLQAYFTKRIERILKKFNRTYNRLRQFFLYNVIHAQDISK